MANPATRTTGNDPVEGADPGGTRPTGPGAGKGGRPETANTPVTSGDRNTKVNKDAADQEHGDET